MARILSILALVSLVLLSGPDALGQTAATMVDSVYFSGVSADGTVACGNSTDGYYTACRWDAIAGLVNLGRSSGEAIGRGGGIPGISDDGNSISSSIISSDTLVTIGLWTKGVGWTELMPPPPADGGNMDEQYGTAWGITGDGTGVVGLYWRPEAVWPDGTAHACIGFGTGGVVDLGSRYANGRANGADFDGDVVVGWTEDPFGTWQPTVWEDGTITVLSETNAMCDAWAVNGPGTVIVGTAIDSVSGTLPVRAAAMWTRDETGWQEQILGYLPGTFGNAVGNVVGKDLTDNGSVVVGINSYDHWTHAGFVWTPVLGMVKADDYFADQGVTFPDGFAIHAVTGVSGDGRTFVGYGAEAVWGAPIQSFIVTIPAVAGVPGARIRSDLVLGTNTPNPFNPSTTIRLSVREPGSVRLEVFDLRGRLVKVVHDGHLAQGDHALTWDGRDDSGRNVASGTYFARARSQGGFSDTRQMTLVK